MVYKCMYVLGIVLVFGDVMGEWDINIFWWGLYLVEEEILSI